MIKRLHQKVGATSIESYSIDIIGAVFSFWITKRSFLPSFYLMNGNKKPKMASWAKDLFE